MAEDQDIQEAEAIDNEDGAGGDEDSEGKTLSKKKLIIFLVLIILVLGGGGAGLFFSGMLDSLLGKEPAAEAGEEGEEAILLDTTPGFFYSMPEMIVNLGESNRKARFLKLTVAIELVDETAVPQIEAVLPRVTDHFQTYLRELRLSDLQGSAGVYRMRQELLARVRVAAHPTEVRDVLFKEILIQ